MLVDTHIHLLASKKSRPDWNEISYTFHVAKEKNIDVLCLTEHRDSIAFEELYSGLFVERRCGGTLAPNGTLQLKSGVVISPGAEISLLGGGDMGVHSDLNTVMNLDSRKNTYSPIELLKILEETGSVYVAVAHHVLIRGKWWRDFEQVIDRLDAIEVPGKQAIFMESYLDLARKYSKGQLSGSDAHTWIQLGVGLTSVKGKNTEEESEGTFNLLDFKRQVVRSETTPCISKFSDELIKISKLYNMRSTWISDLGEEL